MTNYNTGHRNTGDWNTGHYNTGHRNKGHYNAGDRNTGNYNTGDRNTGNRNTGCFNTGYWNTGDRNTGHLNTGNWNTGNRNTGCFNTITPEGGYYFNRWLSYEEWRNTYKPLWLYEPNPAMWVSEENMTAEEKKQFPHYKKLGGYLRENDMKEEWRKAYEGATEEDIQAARDLPNFDYDVFEEITGLDLRPVKSNLSCEGSEVEIDGVIYVLKKKENE